MNNNFLLKANAKINLVLNVFKKKNIQQQYHYLDSIILPIKIYDKIIVQPYHKNEVFFKKKNKLINYKKNICYKIIKFLNNNFPQKINNKFRFIIYKKIPIASGLGGGSSDAASIFNFYNKKFKLNLTRKKKLALLSYIGCDIPFFIINKPAQVQNIGEIIKPIKIYKKYYVLIVQPKKKLFTKNIYCEFDKMNVTKKFNIKKIINALKNGDDKIIANNIGNMLYLPAIKKCSTIKKIINFLKKKFPITSMSGSGSTVFSLSTNRKKIIKIFNKLKKNTKYNVIYTTTLF